MTDAGDDHRSTWGPTALAVLAVAFGVTLRWWQLGATSLWFDEGYTAWVVSLSPADLIAAIRVDTAPPLYYLLLHAWTQLAGTTEWMLRAPSALCATAALAVQGAVAWRLFRKPWARASALAMVACSFMQVAYAHEVRFYAMMSLVGAIGLYLAIRSVEQEKPRVGWLVASGAVWTVALWLNNIFVIYLGCLGGAWLLLPGGRPVRGRLRDLAVVGAIAVVAFLPWVPAFLAQRRAVQANFWSHPPLWIDLWSMLKQVAGINEDAGGLGGAVLVYVAIAVAGTIGLARQWRPAGALLVFGVVPVLLTFVYSLYATSIFMDRAFIVSSLVVPLIVAVPVEAFEVRVMRLAAGGLMACMLALSVRSALADRHRVPNHIENWRDACAYAASMPSAHRLTLFNANEGEMLYDYYARQGDYARSPDQTGTPIGYFDVTPARTLGRVRDDADLAPLRRLLAARPTDDVVFVSAHGPYADEAGRTLHLLREQRWEAAERQFAAVTVYRFVPRGTKFTHPRLGADAPVLWP